MNSKLFSPYSIKEVTIRNRIVMSPMCMYSANNEGVVQPFHLTHYSSRSIGQAGLVFVEATAIAKEGRITEHDLGIWTNNQIEGLRTIVTEIKRYGAKAAIQLAHAGRKSQLAQIPLAPSSIPFNKTMRTPAEMSSSQINETIVAFQAGARRAKEAGFDVIEIHAAHGYLINQFLSPLTNKRTDEYGGSLENRYLFLRNVISVVREVWHGPLFVRISANEYDKAGNSLEDLIQVAKWMKEQGVDLIDVSTGGVVPRKINPYPGYQLTYGEMIRKEVEIPTAAVGLITSGLQAEEIVQNNRADLVFIGRAMLSDPYWPLRAAKELRVKLEAPVQYERGW